MHQLLLVSCAVVLIALGARSALAQDDFDLHADQHLVCFSDGSTTWRIEVPPPLDVVFSRVDNSSLNENTTYSPTLVGPNATDAEDWPEGVFFANQIMQQGLFPLSTVINVATWVRDNNTRIDVMTFNATDNSSVTFSSDQCADWNNCAFAGDVGGLHCWTTFESCCGDNTLSPQCVEADTDDQCCVWFNSSNTCTVNQTCCGMYGPGNNSYSFCCDEDSTCCNSLVAVDGASSCCPAGSVCCAGTDVGFCCQPDEICDPTGNRCISNFSSGSSSSGSSGSTSAASSSSSSGSIGSTTAAASGTSAASTTTAAASATSAGSASTAAPSSTTASTSNAAELTDAPQQALTSSAPAEVTTAAPATTPVTTAAPSTTTAPSSNGQSWTIDGSVTVNAPGWLLVQARAELWNLLQQAIRSDLATYLGVINVTLSEVNANSTSLTIHYSVTVNTAAQAAQVSARGSQMSSSSNSLPQVQAAYNSANPDGGITVSSSSATVNDQGQNSPASGYRPFIIGGVALVLMALFW